MCGIARRLHTRRLRDPGRTKHSNSEDRLSEDAHTTWRRHGRRQALNKAGIIFSEEIELGLSGRLLQKAVRRIWLPGIDS